MAGSMQEGEGKAQEIKTTKWRVENSWGEEKDKPGYLMMTDDWFTEFVYEVVVDKKYVPAAVMALLEEEPLVLPAWDPWDLLPAPLVVKAITKATCDCVSYLEPRALAMIRGGEGREGKRDSLGYRIWCCIGGK